MRRNAVHLAGDAHVFRNVRRVAGVTRAGAPDRRRVRRAILDARLPVDADVGAAEAAILVRVRLVQVIGAVAEAVIIVYQCRGRPDRGAALVNAHQHEQCDV